MRSCILLGALALASAGAAVGGWPSDWEVRSADRSGPLVLNVQPDGSATADLVGLQLEGFADGSRLVLRRTEDGHAELWIGWWTPGRDGMAGFLAGTRTTTRGKIESTTGWYALERAGVGHESAKTVPAPGDPPSPAAQPDLGKGPLAGRWQGAEGIYVVAQDGPRLRVSTPDGREVGGRQTAEAALVIGLRLGCCRGELEAPGVIRWQDGAVWRLAETGGD